MIFAPFAMHTLRSRYWPIVPALSASAFIINYSHPSVFGPVSNLVLWQIYFVMGLVLARFRVPLIGYLYGLRVNAFNAIRRWVLAAGALILIVNVLLSFNISPVVARLVSDGWLPVKLQSAYIHLLNHRIIFDLLFMDSRTGVLRPAITLIFLLSAYLLYQKYKQALLSYTGGFINTMGRDTLWIFVAQAFAIPLLSVIPLSRNNIFNNFLLTSTLILLMWTLTKRRRMLSAATNHAAGLKLSYAQGKYRYLQQYEDI